ncbi:zinc ribbon domain-containing protein [Virgibacillus oceani]|uniref:Zinc-ribbon domain-containing protein n=1 Tax=Virgibacillus oceani TaxID=1479511 RepID=A0A917HKW7_9BACI|nr:zinc ribbon domain-containing protein [Virgibacillus oceani]GGG81840.1 hypothetical protein GCM10011398_29150 [Virgibacillus oceani]
MNCPSCGQQTEEGKFCTNCGAQLPNEEYAATADPTINMAPQVNQSGQREQTGNVQKPNEAAEKLKTAGSNFGHFFVTLLRSPGEAKKANSNDLISASITIVIFSILIALGYHLSLNSVSTGFFGGPSFSFFDSFILPLIEFIILFIIVAALTFAGVKITGQTLSFTDVLAKYGGYLTPFLVLYVIGFLFTLVGLSSFSGLLILVSILGTLLIAPTLILLEQPASGFDRIYVLIAIYVVSLLVLGFFIQSFIQNILSSLMGGSLFGGF